MIRTIALTAALMACHPAFADTPEIRVIDGDTVAVGAQAYRLTRPDCALSFDAPERGTAAGRAATAYLRAWLARADTITLTDTGQRSFDRIVAVLRIDGIEVGQAMIDAGHAAPLENAFWCWGE